MYAQQSLVSGQYGVYEFAVRTVRYVDQPDVVVLSVEPPGGRLVDPLEPVRSHDRRVGHGVLHVVTIGHTALLLAAGLLQPRSHATARRAEMELADQDRAVDQVSHLVDFRPVHGVGVVV